MTSAATPAPDTPTGLRQGFDIAALERYLSAHLPGYAGPLQVEQFEGGQSNPTYRLDTPSISYVMRTKPGPVARLLPSAHAIEREYRVMHALADTAVPVPRMLLLCEDESVIGRAFYLMEHISGRIFWDQTLPGLAPTERTAIFEQLVDVMAALHSVDVSAVGLDGYGRPGSYFERQIARWSRQYQASITEPIAAMDALIDWLPAHLPASAQDASRVAVVHGDYRLDNLMFHPSEPRVLAVLDWELSTLGHPLADFSYLCMSWHIPPATFRGIGGVDLAALGIPDEASVIERYCARMNRSLATPLDPALLRADWNFYLAYNMFRIAAILQGIARRVVDGTASSAQARDAGARARPLAELAWRYAQQA
ncbi:MAG: phosphotransferase [Leptothrix sp. (in: b-proteobacteria)]